MDVLMVTSDADALREGSALEKQLLEYSEVGKHFVVLVLTTQRERYVAHRRGTHLWIIPVAARISILSPWYALKEATRQLYFQGALQTDLVVAQDASRAGFAAWLITRRFRKPLSISLAEDMVSWRWGRKSPANYVAMLIARSIIPAADAISTDSERIRDSLARFSRSVKDRTTLLPRDIRGEKRGSGQAVPLTTQYPNFKFILLCVAPLEREHNVRLAIVTLAGILRIYAHAGLVIVGEGKERGRLETLARKVGVSERVAFVGPVADLAPYYASAHVLLLPSPTEECDDIIAGAAAAGCAVIATPVGLAPLLIEQGVSGFLCAADDPTCFVSVISEMIKHPSMRETVKVNLMLSAEHFAQKSTPESRLAAMRQVWDGAIHSFRALSSDAH